MYGKEIIIIFIEQCFTFLEMFINSPCEKYEFASYTNINLWVNLIVLLYRFIDTSKKFG